MVTLGKYNNPEKCFMNEWAWHWHLHDRRNGWVILISDNRRFGQAYMKGKVRTLHTLLPFFFWREKKSLIMMTDRVYRVQNSSLFVVWTTVIEVRVEENFEEKRRKEKNVKREESDRRKMKIGFFYLEY